MEKSKNIFKLDMDSSKDYYAIVQQDDFQLKKIKVIGLDYDVATKELDIFYKENETLYTYKIRNCSYNSFEIKFQELRNTGFVFL